MSYLTVECDNCGASVIFDEKPYENTLATRYWKSVYTKQPKEFLLHVERQIPYLDKKDRPKTMILQEYIQKFYCNAQCGLEDYERTTRD